MHYDVAGYVRRYLEDTCGQGRSGAPRQDERLREDELIREVERLTRERPSAEVLARFPVTGDFIDARSIQLVGEPCSEGALRAEDRRTLELLSHEALARGTGLVLVREEVELQWAHETAEASLEMDPLDPACVAMYLRDMSLAYFAPDDEEVEACEEAEARCDVDEAAIRAKVATFASEAEARAYFTSLGSADFAPQELYRFDATWDALVREHFRGQT